MIDELPPITYKYPEYGKENPFDLNAKGKYFVNASGFTYLTQSLKPFSFLKPYYTGEIEEAIPIGYKTIIINERLDFIKNKKVIKSFEEDKLEEILKYCKRYKNNQYMIYSKNKIYYEKYNTYIYDLSTNGGWGFYDCIWNSREEAVNYAIAYSEKDKVDNFLMVCRVLESISWH